LYIFHRVDDVERLERLDALTGRQVWRADFEANYRGGIDPDKGPRCVPLIHGRNVYVHGAAGDLHCVIRRNGAKKWSRETLVEMNGDEGFFGVASTPICLEGRLLVNVGGRPDAGIVAFDPETGETLWQQGDERASYASPVSAVLDDQPYAIFVTRYNALAIHPADGTIRFRFPFGQRGATVNAAMPLVLRNHLFVTASYGIGSVLTRIDEVKPTTVWANDQTLSSQYNTPVFHDGHLYGIHGREDVGRAELRCIEVESGTVKWREPGFGVAHVILADNKLLVLKAEGDLLLVEPNDQQFTPLARAHVTSHTARALPALAHGKLYLRDHRPERATLMCLRVGRE
jgi:outer membrane protein assembly factor BamB